MDKKMNFDVSETEKEILEYLWENPQGCYPVKYWIILMK